LIGPYDTPYAFRMALEARLRSTAQSQGTDLQRLQRRVAFERLLARLFVQDDPPWLLKGGYALELRLEERARSTLDLDISVPDPDRLQLLGEARDDAPYTHVVHEGLQQAAERDLNDGFVFLIGQPREERAGAPQGGVRCSVEARLAGRTFARFHLDVGLGDVVLGQPDWVEGDKLLDWASIPSARVALYPVAQQFAEKIHAYTFPWQDRDNTRVKDLVDLVLLANSGLLEPDPVRRALRATFDTRHTHPLPASLPEPPLAWAEPYVALAQELGLQLRTLRDAYTYLDACWRGWGLE
jgi:hypothetical protein